ncbi:MAG: alpha/beta hydrolase [Comamonadaceae bacterium]|nr:MAG: alpha/beta hydrolase [Comamonadaceae bacterium]
MTWILLRGLTREARHWGAFTGQLEQALGDRVITLDLPGNGSLHAEASPTSIEAITERARRQLRETGAMGLQPPFNLLGMSLGGMVAADWAQRYPAEVALLALVNTSMRPFSGPTERLRIRNWPALARLAFCWNDAARVEASIHGLTCNRNARRVDDVALWMRIRQTAPVSTGSALRQLLAAARFTAPSKAPACPVLVLSSEQDQLVDPVCSERLAHAWRAPHRRHRWAGHDLPHDDGNWLALQVARWVREGANWPSGVIR